MQDSPPDRTLANQKMLDHYHRVNSCGSFAVLIQHPTPIGHCTVQYRTRCGSRFCDVCSRIKAKEWQTKLIGSFLQKRCVMITLTFDESAPDPFFNPRYYSDAWDKFLKRLRRKYPSLCFARMVELTKAGRPHFHVLVDRYIPQDYVSKAFEDCGGGKIAWCNLVDAGRATWYITKYVTKSFDCNSRGPYFFFMSRMRSVSASRGLFYTIPRKPGAYFIAFGTWEEVQRDLFAESKEHGILSNKILIDDPHSPPFVWVPDPKVIEPLLEPRMSFPLCFEHLKAWSLDLSMLPIASCLYVYLPPGFTPLESAQLRLGLLPKNLTLPLSPASF